MHHCQANIFASLPARLQESRGVLAIAHFMRKITPGSIVIYKDQGFRV